MRTISHWILDIIEAIEKIEEFTVGYSYEKFCADEKTISAVRDQLMIIGEAANNIPQHIQDKYPKIPWNGMIGSRNILIHQYFRTDPELLFANVVRAKREVKQVVMQIYEDITGNNDTL